MQKNPKKYKLKESQLVYQSCTKSLKQHKYVSKNQLKKKLKKVYLCNIIAQKVFKREKHVPKYNGVFGPLQTVIVQQRKKEGENEKSQPNRACLQRK